MRKLFNLTTVASGAAIGMILAGALARFGGATAKDVVHDQLVPQTSTSISRRPPVGTVATIAGFVLLGIGGILPAVPVAALVADRRRKDVPAKGTQPSPAL